MRVTVVLPHNTKWPVGGYSVAYELADRLALRGHSVTVVHVRAPARPPIQGFPRCGAATARAVLLPHRLAPWFHFRGPIRLFLAPWLSAAFLPRAEVTLLTAYQTSSPRLGSSPKLGCLAQIVFDYEFWASAGPATRAEIATSLGRKDVRHIATSAVVRQMLQEIGAEPVATVHPSIDNKLYSCRTHPTARGPVLGFAWRPEPHKGMQDLIPALKIVRQARPDAIIRCFGAYAAPLLPSYVDQLGYLPTDKQAEFYNQCAVFVLPSHFEGWGLPAQRRWPAGQPSLPPLQGVSATSARMARPP